MDLFLPVPVRACPGGTDDSALRQRHTPRLFLRSSGGVAARRPKKQESTNGNGGVGLVQNHLLHRGKPGRGHSTLEDLMAKATDSRILE